MMVPRSFPRSEAKVYPCDEEKTCSSGTNSILILLCVSAGNLDSLRPTGLRCPLHQLIGECSDAFVRDGCQREGVLSVRFQTLDCVRIPGPKGQLLL